MPQQEHGSSTLHLTGKVLRAELSYYLTFTHSWKWSIWICMSYPLGWESCSNTVMRVIELNKTKNKEFAMITSCRSGHAYSQYHWTTRPIGNVLVLLTSESIFCYRNCTMLHELQNSGNSSIMNFPTCWYPIRDYLVSDCWIDGAYKSVT